MIRSKNNIPIVSVLMAAHNEQSRIAVAIQSIIDQTFADWEFIVVDDCSSDDTVEILESSCKQDDRIHLIINDKNMGLAASLNRGIAIARGKYIARMDADDVCYPDRLRLQKEYLDNNSQIAVIGGNANLVDETGAVIGKTQMPSLPSDIKKSIVKKCPLIHPSVMYRKSFITEMGGYDERMKKKQDYDLWLRGARQYDYANIDDIVIKYHVQKSKSLSTDVYGLCVRLVNSYRRKDIVIGPFWAFVIFGVNLLRKAGYRQKLHRKKF